VTASFVIDASVVVEFLAPGRHGDAADRILGGLAWPTPLELIAPDLLLLEVAEAMRKLALRKAISVAAADRSVSSLSQLAIGTIASGALLVEAWTLRDHMTLYDASYAALARALERPLVTVDRKLLRACSDVEIEAFAADDAGLSRILTALEQASG